jgi:hypothetical protein
MLTTPPIKENPLLKNKKKKKEIEFSLRRSIATTDETLSFNSRVERKTSSNIKLGCASICAVHNINRLDLGKVFSLPVQMECHTRNIRGKT